MRRYLFDECPDLNLAKRYDVLIVGGGLAGLYAALNLSKNLSVALVVKTDFEAGSSWLAQGGMAAVVPKGGDTTESHLNDTLTAGAGHCKETAVRVLVKEGPSDIRQLAAMGVPFDREPDGSFHATREGGHSHNRIVHCGGDATGMQAVKRLGELVLLRSNITVYFRHYLVDILTDDGAVRGIVVNNGKHDLALLSRNCIIATGGIGQLYRYTTNPVGTTGDGIAACLRAGAPCEDMEFVQFHPTAFALGEENGRMFLISEAVRGEGGILRNKFGRAFMEHAHPLKDLAPRDIVTRCVLAEMEKTGDDKEYLDVSSMTRDFFTARFPTITEKCEAYGVHVPADWIPIRPTQHYLMGGVKTDLFGRTTVEGLYVCGEAACTGVQGANRLASNSTMECLVFGRRAAQDINDNCRPMRLNEHLVPEVERFEKACPADREIEDIIQTVRCMMTDRLGAVRTLAGIRIAVNAITELCFSYEDCRFTSLLGYQMMNNLTVSRQIAASALMRPNSLGAHSIVADQ